VTAGDDCKIRFWDKRNAQKGPLLEMIAHSHWVWQAKYNPFHDRLLLTSSTDTNAALWRVLSLSADAKLEEYGASVSPTASPSSRSIKDPSDIQVHTYTEHEDSIYGVAWSASDPWIFATLSYDGRVVINTVPRGEKYKILL
ncbi:hypothetical protein CYMTET_27454, partial [Cymbomonas tetramitiformis]